MAHLEVEPGQFDDAPEGEISGRGDVAYIDTVQDLGEPQTAAVLEHEFPPSSDEEDEDEDDSLLDEDEYYDQNRVEDEDWEVAERDFTKQYNRLRQHVAVRTGNAQGVTSSVNQRSTVASLPAVNMPRAVVAKATTTGSAAQPHATAKDRTTNQLEAYAQKYNTKLAKLEQPYQAMGVGVNRKGPSAHANLKDKSDRATNEQVLDPRTRLILFKMIGRGLLDEVNGCVSTGKEANVYHALTPDKKHLALKIYKTSILVFKDRSKYVTGEYRFRRGYSRNPRKMVRLWAEKEMRNLRRLKAAGINCPEPLEVRENVLVMSLVGDEEGWASPRLKDTELTLDQLTPLYLSLVLTVRTMFHVCKLVHADLSEYNILYHDGALWIIDVSQSVEHDHPAAFDFLRSDLSNVEEFFGRAGVSTLGLRKTFEFVTRETLDSAEGETDEAVLKRWIEEREALGAQAAIDDEQADKEEPNKGNEEHEDSVFMKSFIPRTLNEVYDPERDVERVARGEGKDLIYADTIGVVAGEDQFDEDAAPKVKKTKTKTKGVTFEDEDRPIDEHDQVAEQKAQEQDGDEQRDEASDEDDSEEEDDEKDTFVERKPKGHKFEDKDAKKERKKAAKEEAREKRKTKMPKAEKKKLLKKTARSS